MSRRATQRSRSRNAPSRASTSVASQHAATFQSPIGIAPSRASTGVASQHAAAFQSPVGIAPSTASTSIASQHAATFQSPVELSNELKDEVLQWTYQLFMETMQALHQQSTHTRPCLDRSRIQEMQRSTLSSTKNTLHRAYRKLLRACAETGSAETHSRDDLAATVRDLSDAIMHKFGNTILSSCSLTSQLGVVPPLP